MSDILPLAAVRYTQADQTTLVAPPYDVLTAQDKQNYLAGNPHNIVAIDLPHVPPKNAGPAEVYATAGKTLHDWLAQDVLRRDAAAAFYAYQQTYSHTGTHAGLTHKRRGFFCRVRLEEFDATGTIHPHEQTFSGPKEDRLMLLRATQANLSPIFGLFDDPENRITDRLFAAVGNAPPTARAPLPAQNGSSSVLSELWPVADATTVAAVRKAFADKHLYIADGHHRYTTALNWRRELAAQQGALPPEHPANFILFVVIAMQDPGLIVLPTHRVAGVLKGFSCAALLQAAAGCLRQLPGRWTGVQLADLEKKLPEFGAHAMGVYDPGRDEAVAIQPMHADPLSQPDQDAQVRSKSAPWRQLDVAILQHLIFDRLVTPRFAAGQNLHWGYPHEAGEVAALCRGGEYQGGFLLQPTPLQAVRELCNHHELMPQKSTFFYPKLATGMVINALF